jgi:NAD(P)-dependent dehydrogenase (short-subunit alcohol dehydrogenase family)
VGFLEERAGLAGKVAVVIGGAEGLGDLSLDLARAGVDVALCDINGPALEQRARELEDLGRLRLARTLDARDAEALAGFYAELDERTDRLDIVVNVAGGAYRKRFTEATDDDWARDAEWNLLYVARSCRHAIPRIQRGGAGGSIVNLTTVEAHRAVPGYAMYGAFKAAVTSLTRSLALEHGADGIRVNCLAPDFAPTPGSFRNREVGGNQPPGFADPARRDELIDAQTRLYIPLRRLGTPQDFGNCVLFLVSDLGSYVTGQTIHCDGGTWASSGWSDHPVSGHLPAPGPAELERLFPA